MKLHFEQIPAAYPEQTVWGCKSGDRSFVIVLQDGWYSASVKDGPDARTKYLSDQYGWRSFLEAKQACERQEQ